MIISDRPLRLTSFLRRIYHIRKVDPAVATRWCNIDAILQVVLPLGMSIEKPVISECQQTKIPSDFADWSFKYRLMSDTLVPEENLELGSTTSSWQMLPMTAKYSVF